MSKILPIKLQNDLNGYLIYALPYCILCSYESYNQWLMEHYICSFDYLNDSGDVTMEYADGIAYNDMRFPRTPLDINCLSYSDLSGCNITEITEKLIDCGRYIVLFLDEYYVPEHFAYEKAHFVHDSMIYGYDENFFYSIAFNDNSKFIKQKYPKNIINKAYWSGKDLQLMDSIRWIKDNSIISLKPRYMQNKYEFSGDRFIKALFDYNNGHIEYEFKATCLTEGRDYYIGINNSCLFTEIAKDESRFSKAVHYPAIHAWYESKKLIYDRIDYFAQNIDDSITSLKEKYKTTVVNKAKLLRLIFLKSCIGGNHFKQIYLFEDIYKNEKSVINQILDLI